MMVRTDTDILLFSMHSDECPGCYKYWFDTVCDHISDVISRLSYLRHDVIRTLFPYHYTGIWLPRSTSGCYRDGNRFLISVCKLRETYFL